MAAYAHPWKQCIVCRGEVQFSSSKEFISHLRQVHCRREGGSYVCHYGYNGVCNSLPLEGVNDADYERHVLNHHVRTLTAARRQEPQRCHSQSSHRRTGSSGEVSTLQTLAHTPNVVADGLKWSLHNASQNLPALLNDPSRGRQRDLFTKTWGEGFVDKPVVASSLLPDVNLSSFGDYVRGISKRYRKHLRRGNSAHLSGHRLVEDDSVVDGGSELAAIPRLWFDADFDLRRRQTFQLICPPPRSPPHSSSPSFESARRRSSSGRLKRTPSPRSAASPVPTTEPSILEQLTHYMDLVEIRIAGQIAEKSESFFDAMSSHDVLMDQVTQASRSVQTLRRGMASLRQEQVVPAVCVLRGRRQRRNGTGLLQKLRLMSTVQQTPATIQLVLASCDYVGALDVIATSQEVLQQELAGVQAFRHLGTELSEMRKAIDVMVSADYIRLIAADLNRPLDQSPAIEQEQLLAIVFGMIRLHNFSLVDTYRDEAYTAVRAVLKQVSIEALSEADTPDDVTAAGGCDGGASDGGSGNQPLSHLSPTQWVALLRRACRDLAKLLSRIKAVSDMIAEVVDAAAGRPADLPLPSSATGDNLIRPSSGLEDRDDSPTLPVSISDSAEDVMISGELHARIRSSLSSLISSVCDYVHERCAKLLQTCMQDSVLDVQQFLSLADVIRQFVVDCEKLCGRRSTALHLAFQSRASQFVGRFHGERRAKLQLLLESERWRQADVPAEFQRLADHVQSTGEACLPPSPLRTSTEGVRTGGAVGCGRQLVVGQRRYAVVGTVLLLLRILLEYCDSARHLPAVAAELLNRLVELLQLYNSRCCQLVVGAGAIQLVGLKTISIRNLSLSARCLQLIQHFIPLIHKLYKELVGDRGDTALRQLNADYDAHIAEIDGKLVNIVCDICDNQLNRWQAKPPVPSQSFRSVCRAVSKLYEATSDVLERDHRTALMRRVCSRLLHSLRRHVTQRLNIKADGGPRHGVVTSEVMFYQQHLTSSCDFTPAESILQSLWSTNSTTNNNSEPSV